MSSMCLREAVELSSSGSLRKHFRSKEGRTISVRNAWFEIVKDDSKLEKFMTLLSAKYPFLIAPHQLLMEWFALRNEDAQVDADAKMAEQALLKIEPAQYIDLLGNPKSYHDCLARLYFSEFPGPAPSRYGSIIRIADLRIASTEWATCYRLAGCALKRNSIPTGTVLLHGTMQDQSVYQPKLCPARAPPIASIHTKGRNLWDRRARKTRTMEEIEQEIGMFPKYLAISHTWGSSQKEVAPWVPLPGLPWRIPQLTKFNVEELPDLLSHLPWDYIWIDLLTIPQGLDLPPITHEFQQDEIFRQPSVFREADRVVVWLDDVPSWTSLPAAIKYLSLKVHSTPGYSNVHMPGLSQSLQSARQAAETPSELLSHARNQPNPSGWDPNGWFRSVWGLREACVCPDMLICNAKWEALEIAENTPVSLIDLVSLLNVAAKEPDFLSAPLGAQELLDLVESTGLNLLPRLSSPIYSSRTIVCSESIVKSIPGRFARITNDMNVAGVVPFSVDRKPDETRSGG